MDCIKGRLFIIALFSIHSQLLTKEDAVKVLQVVDDAVASEFVKKIIGAMARAARVGMQKPNEQQTTASAERTDGDRSGYELPEELKGLFVVYNKLVQFIRDSHIDPIRKPNFSSLLPSVFLADDSPFLLNDNVFQGAIDMLFEEHVLTPVTFMRFLKSRSIDLFPDDVEEILHLRKGTLDVEETKPRIVRLKLL